MAKFKRINAEAEITDMEPIAAEKLVSGLPNGGSNNQHINEKGNFFVGVWQSDAGCWNVSYSEDEFCTILEGEAIITEENGTPQRVKAGDHFTMSAGFEGTWETVGSVKKLYVIYED